MQQGALAAAGLARHRDKVAVGDVQADVLEGLDLGRALAVGFGDALEDDEGGRLFLGPGCNLWYFVGLLARSSTHKISFLYYTM